MGARVPDVEPGAWRRHPVWRIRLRETGSMFYCTPLVLPPDARTLRESVRPIEWRQPGFADAFDASTLFYDVVRIDAAHESSLVFVGPPLLNLLPAFHAARIGGRAMA